MEKCFRKSEVAQGGKGKVEIFKVLKYSFDRLDMNHESVSNEFNPSQLCFLHFSLYPEDYQIVKEGLVEELISYGLVGRGKSRREQVDRGHVIVDNLVKVCLLEEGVIYRGNKYVKMHDQVRGMALKIGGRKYMVRAGDKSLKEIPMEQEWTEQLEKVSLMNNDITRIGEGTSPNCPNLSKLLLQHNYQLQVIPDQFFWRMQGLRTLNLGYAGISRLSNSIVELESLEVLILECCRKLKHVPNLGKLKALRELNLDRTAMEEVPQGVEELDNLEVLSLDATHLKVFPRGLLLKLVRLQILRIPRHVQVGIKDIQKQLEEFRGNVREFNNFITSLAHDHTLYRIQVGSLVCKEIFFDVMSKKVVAMGKCSLEVEKVQGQGIELLKIVECEGLSSSLLDNFSRFHNLRRLFIKRCGGIECIVRSELELASGFSTLLFIRLMDLKGLVETGAASATVVFPSLKDIYIARCKKMRRLGSSLLEFPKLDYFRIKQCDEIEEIFKEELGRGGRKEGRKKK